VKVTLLGGVLVFIHSFMALPILIMVTIQVTTKEDMIITLETVITVGLILQDTVGTAVIDTATNSTYTLWPLEGGFIISFRLGLRVAAKTPCRQKFLSICFCRLFFQPYVYVWRPQGIAAKRYVQPLRIMCRKQSILYFCLTTFVFLPIFSQTRQIIFLPKSFLNDKSNVTGFIPKGYSILDSLSGELTGDNFKDLLMILKSDGEDTMYYPVSKRPFYILTGLPNNEYKLDVKNDNIVYSHDLGGVSKSDPYDNMKLDRDIFYITHSGGMGAFHWQSKIYFQYSPKEKKWCLLKKEMHETTLDYHYGDTTRNNEPQITVASDSTHIETERDFGKIYFEDFDIYKH
jgi:hypothetical protein